MRRKKRRASMIANQRRTRIKNAPRKTHERARKAAALAARSA